MNTVILFLILIVVVLLFLIVLPLFNPEQFKPKKPTSELLREMLERGVDKGDREQENHKRKECNAKSD